MSTMKAFYQSLAAVPETHDPYLGALAELTKADAAQIKNLTSSYDWQNWSAPNAEPAKAA